MKGRLFLDVVVRQSSSIFQLLSSKDQSLLIWRNTFLVLDLCLDILNGITRLHLQSDGLASQGLDKDLHTSSQSQDKMKGRLFLDVVVGQSSSIFQLFSSKDQSLLIWRDSFFVLDLGLNVLNGITRLHLQSDGLTSQGLDKDLHTSSQSEHKMKGALFLDIVVRQSSSIFQLFSSKDQSLLIWRNTFLILDLGLNVLNSITRLHLQSDGLA